MKKKNWFTNLPALAKAALLIIPSLIVWKIFRGGWKLGGDIKGAIKNDQQVNAIAKVSAETGIDAYRSQEIVLIAADVYSAFWETAWGMGEDEEKAAQSLDRCKSINEAKAAAKVYRINYNKSMYDDFKKYSSTWGDPQPQKHLLDAIKGI